ncbi:hypothetical protein ACFXPM_35970 [Streptomyces sp. NPDC059095]|uniref:hypothetical protein n=1 Tax=Streptomyces sp. NPDC059095 TaxID=3346726 RepID=UPI0036B0EB34
MRTPSRNPSRTSWRGSRPPRRPAVAVFSVLALALTALTVPAAHAEGATPPGGTLDSATKSLTWQSPVYEKGTVDSPDKCPPPAQDPDGAVCARFDLTVKPPAGQWDDNPEGGVPVSVQWATPTDDFDLYVYDDAGKQVASSAGTADPEATVIPKASGTYHVVVVPYDVHHNSFTGTAYLPEPTDAGNLTSFGGKDGTYDIAAGALKARVDFLADDTMRLRAAPDGTFTDPPGSHMIQTRPTPQKNTNSFETGAY